MRWGLMGLSLATVVGVACSDPPCEQTLTCPREGTGGGGGAGGSVTPLADGETCEAAEACASGFCVDGVCCASSCEAACMTCVLATAPGACSAAEAGSDPRGDCGDGVCDGSAACATGDVLWFESFGAADDQSLQGIVTDSADNVLMTGRYSGSFAFNGSGQVVNGTDNTFVAKLDHDAGLQWSGGFGDAAAQQAQGIDVASSDAFAITGANWGSVSFGGPTHSLQGVIDQVVAVFGPDKSYRWSRSYGSPGTIMFPSTVAMDASDNVVIGGSFTGSVDFGGGAYTSSMETDAFVAKLNATGDYLWSHHYGDAGFQTVFDIATDNDGNVFVVGVFAGTIDFGGGPLTSDGQADVFVLKLDPDGNHLWSRSAGTSDSFVGSDIALAPTGHVLVVGRFSDSLTFGNDVLTSAGGTDVVVVRFDPLGEFEWARQFGNFNDQLGDAITADASGNAIIVGAYAGSMELDDITLTSTGGNDGFVAKLSPTGTVLWAHSLSGTTATQRPSAASVDSAGNIIVGGYFDGSITAGDDTHTSQGGYDIFLLKLSP